MIQSDIEKEKMISQAIYELYSFIGIYDFEENSLLCTRNKDKLLHIAEGEVCTQYIERLLPYVREDEIKEFTNLFCWKREEANRIKEIALHFQTKDDEVQLYCVSVVPDADSKKTRATIFMKKLTCKEIKYAIQDYMEMVSKLAFSTSYVLVGTRDAKRKFCENIYDAENTLGLPRVCNLETFSKRIDEIIYPEDMPIYQKHIRNCDNEDMTKAEFRMYDAKGELHNYQGMTCRITTPVGDKHILLLRKQEDDTDKSAAKTGMNKKQQQIVNMLSGIGYGFDMLVHLNINNGEYIIYEKNEGDKRILSRKDNFYEIVRQRVHKLTHEEDKPVLLKCFESSYLQNYFQTNDLLELEYRRKNGENGYNWTRLLARRMDKNKKVKDIVFCLISVPEEHSRNLTNRLRTKYLCEMLENQNEYLNKALQKATIENDIKESYKEYLSYEIDLSLECMRYVREHFKKQISGNETEAILLRYLTIISDNMELMKDNILSIPGIEQGNLEIHMEKTSIKALLKEVIDAVSVESWIREQTLSVNIADMPDVVLKTDAYRMKQMLINTLLNEIRFSKSGAILGIRINRTQIMTNGNNQYVIYIENNTEVPEQVTKSAQKKEDERRYQYRLYVIRKMAQLLHGDIFVDYNQYGRKISFVFERKISSPHFQ